MRFCSSGQNIGQYIGHIAAGCSHQNTSLAKFPTVLRVHIGQNSKEYFEKWIKYFQFKKVAEIQDGSYTYGGIQTYRGHPNMKGESKHMGGVQTYGGIKTYKGHPNIWGASKHTGRCPNIWGHSNIQGYI